MQHGHKRRAPVIRSLRFAAAVDYLSETNSEIAQEIDTAMSLPMFISMLRWPATSKRFKHFVVTTMIERQELNVLSKISEVAREKSNKAGAFDSASASPSRHINARCLAGPRTTGYLCSAIAGRGLLGSIHFRHPARQEG